MKAVVFHGVGDIRLEDVKEPKIQQPTDAIVRITASAICGTDLHFVRGTVSPMRSGTILGHEGVGIVEEVGSSVRDFQPGDRVVIPSTIACGSCTYCRSGYFSQCDNANPNGSQAGTAFYGGPQMTGPFDGLQAEKARIPFANVGMVKLPYGVTDDQAILISDIFPTGWFGAKLAEIKKGDIVAVFGCGPVGQFAIASAKLQGATRILAIDTIPTRLEMARAQGAEIIDFDKEDPVEAVRQLTGGAGADRAIDAVGVDSVRPHRGPGARQADKHARLFKQQLEMVAPKTKPKDGNWEPGDAPGLVLEWAVKSLSKAGTLAVIGVYPETMTFFPLGAAMNRNITLNMGNCNHRKYIPELVEMVRLRAFDPTSILTHVEPFTSAIEAYKAFDKREAGWVKVELVPRRMAA